MGIGLPDPPLSTAVKVTGWPLIPGLTDEVSVIVGVVWAKADIAINISDTHKPCWKILRRIPLGMNSLVFLVCAFEICNRMVALKVPDAGSHFIN